LLSFVALGGLTLLSIWLFIALPALNARISEVVALNSGHLFSVIV